MTQSPIPIRDFPVLLFVVCVDYDVSFYDAFKFLEQSVVFYGTWDGVSPVRTFFLSSIVDSVSNSSIGVTILIRRLYRRRKCFNESITLDAFRPAR